MQGDRFWQPFELEGGVKVFVFIRPQKLDNALRSMKGFAHGKNTTGGLALNPRSGCIRLSRDLVPANKTAVGAV